MKEEIVHFLPEEDSPFMIEMAGISWCDGAYRIERVRSSILIMEAVLQGQGTVNVDGCTYRPAAGDVYLLPRGSDHHYFADRADPWVKIWFNVRGNLVDHLMQAYRIQNLHHVPGLDMEAAFRAFLEAAKDPEAPQDAIFRRTAILFHQIVQTIAAHAGHAPVVRNPLALAMRDHLNRNLEQRVRIGDLGRLICKSPSQAIRIFKSEFGTTPVDYLLARRMETAKQLLANTGLQVNEIAWRLGFADEHYFSAVFRSRTGMAPGRYRAAAAGGGSA